ncbi:MAG: hypothetical protein JNM34_07700 [Chthonomonadaceae bacterium]|nr:hypothetical protein [Chthonomonadaceae bacterium]
MTTEKANENILQRVLANTAAVYGPGFRGQRLKASSAEKARLRADFERLGLDPPPFLDDDKSWIDRQAKLFEAGDFPDKGVTVSSETLENLAENFDSPVPVLIEHGESPLHLGFLTDVFCQSSELFGTLTLSEEANDLIEASGAKSLSLGLSPDLQRIQEVSLVRNPRVASATLFTGTVMEPARNAPETTQNMDQVLNDYVQRGLLIPAQIPFARKLCEQDSLVTFDQESLPMSRVVMRLIESGASHGLLSELAPAGSQSPSMQPDEQAFYDRYFAGLSLEDIAKNRGV